MGRPPLLPVLSLDAGGVLVHPCWATVRDLLGAPWLDASRLEQAEHIVVAELDSPEGVQDDQRRWFRFMARVLHLAGATDLRITEALPRLHTEHQRRVLWRAVPAEVIPTLQTLRAQGQRIAVVSNSNGRLQAILDELGLSPFFDEVLDSTVVGVEKPDPRIFHILCERMGHGPAEVLHVGDVVHIDVVGAEAAGCRALLLDKAGLRPQVPSIRSLAELLDS